MIVLVLQSTILCTDSTKEKMQYWNKEIFKFRKLPFLDKKDLMVGNTR